MHAQRILLMLLLAVLLCPLGVTAQKPTPEEANLLAEEPAPEAADLVADEPAPADVGTVSSVCGTVSGTRFNLEPRPDASPQHTQTVDLLRNRVAAGVDLVVGGSTDLRDLYGEKLTGYYVSRDADCGAEFEGRLPDIAGHHGGGRPVVVADPTRNAVFMADLRYDDTGAVVGIGLFRTTAATLLNPTTCPTGTHTVAQAVTCWPTRRFIPESALGRPNDPLALQEFHLTVDERTSGTGAGNVYLVGTGHLTNPSGRYVMLLACTNTLTTCSPAVYISGDIIELIHPHGAVRPDGRITVTWLLLEQTTLPYSLPGAVLYRSCAPVVPPALLTCGADRAVAEISDRVLVASAIPIVTYSGVVTHPKHDHRQDANGTETYVVWEQCKVSVLEYAFRRPMVPFCPDADVMMAASRDDGATWSAPTCVSCGAEDQFLPTIKTDRSRNIVNIAFYGSGSDPTFQRRARIFLAHINPGTATPDPVTDIHTLATLLNDLEAGLPLTRWTNDIFSSTIRYFASALGYIGLAARGTGADGGSRAYVHFTYNNIQGLYSGVAVPEMNNHLGRLDY